MTLEKLKVVIDADTAKMSAAINQIQSQLNQLKSYTLSSTESLNAYINNSANNMASAFGTASNTLNASLGAAETLGGSIGDTFARTGDVANSAMAGVNAQMLATGAQSQSTLAGIGTMSVGAFGTLAASGTAALAQLSEALNSSKTKAKEYEQQIISLKIKLNDLKYERIFMIGASAEYDKLSEKLEEVEKKFKREKQSVDDLADAYEKLSTKLKIANAEQEAAGKKAKKAGAGIGSLSTLIKGAGIAALGMFAIQSLNTASALEEVQNVVDTTFGEMAVAINDFADIAMEEFGLSELAAKQFAGTMGAMLKSSGLASEDAAKMSMNLTALSGDLASFYNLDAESAFAKLRAGISGETEPLKQLGINMSVANMEAFALQQGITKTYQNMTQAEQAILRYNYLLQVTSPVQGDFARTQESMSNQAKIMSMSFDELKANLGQGLIKIFTPVLRVLNLVLSMINKVIEGLGKMFGMKGSNDIMDTSVSLAEMNEPIQEVEKGFKNTANNANDTAKGIKNATSEAKKLKNALMGIDEINKINDNSSSGLGNMGGALDGIDDTIDKLGDFNKTIKGAYQQVEDLLNAVGDSGENLSSVFGTVTLDMAQIRSTAKGIINDKNLDKLSTIYDNLAESDRLANSIVNLKQKIDAYNWMIETGITLTTTQQEEYRKLVSQYITDTNAYFAKRKETLTLSMEIAFGENADIVKNFKKFISKEETELYNIGAQIEKKMNEALADGVFSLDEAQEINNLILQRNAILQKVATREQNATFDKINISFGDLKLTEESYNKLSKELDAQLEKITEGYDLVIEEVSITLQAMLEAGEISPEQYQQYMKEAKAEIQKNIENGNLNVISFKLAMVAEMIFNDKEISKDISKGFKSVEKFWNDAAANLDLQNMDEKGWDSFVKSSVEELQKNLPKLTAQNKKDVKKIYESLQPEKKQLEKLAQEYIEMGETPPKEISKALTDVNILGALADDVDSLIYLVGNQANNNPEVKKALQTWAGTGKEFPASLATGFYNTGSLADLKNGIENIFNVTDYHFGVGGTTGKKTAEETAKTIASGYNTLGTEATKNTKGVLDGVNENLKTPSKVETAKATTESSSKKIAAGWNVLSAEGKTKALSSLDSIKSGLGNAEKTTAAQNEASKTIGKIKTKFNFGSTSSYSIAALNSLATGFGNDKATGSIFSKVNSMVSGVKTRVTQTSSFGISNGSSKTFEGYGKNVVQGFNKGIGDNKNSSILPGSHLDKWIQGINNKFTSSMGIHSPSRLFKGYGRNTVEGYNLGIEDEMDSTLGVLGEWASEMEGFADNIDMGELQMPTLPTMDKPQAGSFKANINPYDLGGAMSSAIMSGSQDKELKVVFKIGETAFAETVCNSINALTNQRGEIPLLI